MSRKRSRLSTRNPWKSLCLKIQFIRSYPHIMQLVGVNYEMNTMKNMVKETNGKQERLFDDRLSALTMIQMQKNLRKNHNYQTEFPRLKRGWLLWSTLFTHLCMATSTPISFYNSCSRYLMLIKPLMLTKRGKKDVSGVVHSIVHEQTSNPQSAATSERVTSYVANTESWKRRIRTLS